MLALLTALPWVWRLVSIGAVLLALGGAYWGWHHHVDQQGYNRCVGEWNAANDKAAADAAQRDRAIAKETEAKVAQATSELKQQADALQQQVDDYGAQLTLRSGGACALTDDDIRRLQSIR